LNAKVKPGVVSGFFLFLTKLFGHESGEKNCLKAGILYLVARLGFKESIPPIETLFS